MTEEKNSSCLVLIFYSKRICIFGVRSSRDKCTLQWTQCIFTYSKERRWRRAKEETQSFCHYLQWFITEKIVHVPWGISQGLEEGRSLLEEVVYGAIFGQKITTVLVSILLPHHPYFLFWFHTGFHFSHVTHITTLSEFKKDQGKACLPFWHPRETRSCQQSRWALCWRRAGTRCCWLTPCGHAGCICTSRCRRREQECSTRHAGYHEQQTTLG